MVNPSIATGWELVEYYWGERASVFVYSRDGFEVSVTRPNGWAR